MKPHAAFFTDERSAFRGEKISVVDAVYGKGRREQIATLTELYPEMICADNFDTLAPELADLEIIFTTWGFPVLTESQIDRLPKLKIIFHAAGATPYRYPYLERGVRVCSATAANAIPVAEFTLMQMMMGLKGLSRNMEICCDRKTMLAHAFKTGRGIYGGRVTLIGQGSISRHLQKLLGALDLDVQVIGSRELMQDVSALDKIFATSDVVSNHLPNRDDNMGIFKKEHFLKMPPQATFINTGRGDQVDEAGLCEAAAERPDLTLFLDVQAPEPPEADSPLYTTPNIYMTTHIAGAFRDELLRMADYMIDDFRRWLADEPLLYEVQPDML